MGVVLLPRPMKCGAPAELPRDLLPVPSRSIGATAANYVPVIGTVVYPTDRTAVWADDLSAAR
jgi:hypothetical protein